MSILKKADGIVNHNTEEKERQYGPFSESMTKAAKQVFDIVDSNIEAASKAGESAVSPSGAGKAKGKKAA